MGMNRSQLFLLQVHVWVQNWETDFITEHSAVALNYLLPPMASESTDS